MMTETPIAFGLTMVVCLALFFYCWYIRKLRYRLTSVQVSATPNEVHEQTGIKKEVVDTFPTVKMHELKIDIKDELQCPICLVEYGDAEVLRKLPYCDHVFHIHCIDSWLKNQVTCPVCRIVLTEFNPKPETNRQQRSQSAYCRGPSTPHSVTIEVAAATPAWVLVNQPLPLPPTTPNSTSLPSSASPESSNLNTNHRHPSNNLDLAGESPLLLPPTAGWGAIYLQKSTHTGFSFRSRAADIAIIESKECISHASISERWMSESFSFGISTSDDSSATGSYCFDSLDEAAQTLRSATQQSQTSSFCRRDEPGRGSLGSWRSRSAQNSWDFGYEEDLEDQVVESKVGSQALPLTVSPEHCSFEFLPIVTGPGGDYSLTDFHR